MAGKAFEAAGPPPGNENNAISRRRCPEKPYCPLYTEGIGDEKDQDCQDDGGAFAPGGDPQACQ